MLVAEYNFLSLLVGINVCQCMVLSVQLLRSIVVLFSHSLVYNNIDELFF